jgi:integrase
MSRRGHGEGSIHKRSDGRWAAVLDLGYQDGKRKRKYFYGETRREVAERLIAAQRDHQQGLPALGERQTLGQYLTGWLAATKPTIEPTTWERYESDVRLHLSPGLGRIRMAKLTPQQVAQFFTGKLERGAKPRSVRNMRAVLRRALNEAQAHGLVSRNVAALVRPPKAARGEMHVYDPEQTRRLLAAAQGTRLEAWVVLAVSTGARQGELLGLHWRDVSLDGHYINVQTQLRRLRDAGLVLKDVKTSGSRRKIALTDAAVEALRAHRTRQLEERLVAGNAWQDGDLVFCNSLGGPLYPSNVRAEYYIPIVRAAGLPYIRPHDLRHTAATLMLLQGVHPKVVSEMLGHASVAITLSLYSHVLPDMQLAATTAMDRVLHG